MSDLNDIIVIDPPWAFASNSVAKPGRNARRHYPTMTDKELRALPIPAAKDAVMFLWTTSPMLERAIRLIPYWGFEYKSCLIWDKQMVGTGHWVRNRHELVLICRRGRFPCPRPAPFSTSIIESKRREHSRKPDELQDRIDEVWPEARKIEMFARQQRSGWAAWGNEVGKFDAA